VTADGEGTEVGPRDHVIQFYRRDEELADEAGAYLADAVHDDGLAVVIASQAHRLAFEDRLAAAGVDVGTRRNVGTRRTSGGYLAADADEMLRRFMTGGRPDVAGFENAACSLIEEPARRGQPVRVYGELVAGLWDAGLVPAAIELEEMWVGLGRRFPFALWCGHRTGPGAGQGAVDGLAELCRLHGAVVGQAPAGCGRPGTDARVAELSREFAASLDSIGPARRFAVAALEAAGHGDTADDAALVVTELATNAVVHAQSAFTVTITIGEDSVRISVRDRAALPGNGTGPALPAMPLHGLGVVAAMAARWGAGSAGPGKDVWAELRREEHRRV
jgi:anti-sigma regulatory factor (Ser/Thr protein kinase)